VIQVLRTWVFFDMTNLDASDDTVNVELV